MQARSCLGSALSSPPLRGQQALPVQRPEVCSFHGGPCFWPQAVTGILFLLTASFLLDFPQFPDWPPPRYHLTLLFLFSAQIYLIYTLFSFLCVRMCVCTCHRLLYSTLLQSLLWFSWLGRNKKKKKKTANTYCLFSSLPAITVLSLSLGDMNISGSIWLYDQEIQERKKRPKLNTSHSYLVFLH